MKKPILYMTAAATGLAMLHTPLQTQAAPCQPQMSVIQICPESATSLDVYALLDQLGITECLQLPDCTAPVCETPNSAAPKNVFDNWCQFDPFCYGQSQPEQNKDAQPDTEEPAVAQPDTEEPAVAQPDTEEPAVAQPDTEEPAVTQPDTEEPAVTQPVVEQPMVTQPVVEQPVVTQPVVEQPATLQPVADNPKPTDSTQSTGNTRSEESPQAETAYHEYVLRIVSLVNAERAKAGLQPVTLSRSVTAVAELRARETVSLFSHTRPNGTSCFTALAEAGINYRGAGENIAYGQRSPEEVMEGWMNSSGHRANILNPNFTTIGVGYYQSARGVNYWSQMFTY